MKCRDRATTCVDEDDISIWEKEHFDEADEKMAIDGDMGTMSWGAVGEDRKSVV